MNQRRPTIGFPLLVKELTEAAARRRTYLVRVGYALLLFVGAFLMFFGNIFSRQTSPLALLGQGENMFLMIVALQFTGIYLFLPAMTCSAITSEKERDTFALLLLTRLGQWTILIEKLVGRLIPMFTFMLLALPLMAFAYTYGGVQSAQIWGAVWLLGLTSVQVAAMCLMFSAYCRTTTGAFMAAHLFYFFIFFAIPGLMADVAGVPEQRYMYFVGPAVYFDIFDWRSIPNPWPQVVSGSLPLILSTIVFLVLARRYLVRRAFVQPRNLLRSIFRGLDSVFVTLNNNWVTKGVVLVKESAALPVDRPVAWRETMKKNLSQFRYVLRICLLFELPIVAVAVILLFEGPRSSRDVSGLTVLLFMLWILTALILTVQASNLIASERSRQTLDVLLATPLSGRDILLEKVQGLRRLMYGLSVCFLSIFFCEAWLRWGLGSNNFNSSGFSLYHYSTVRYLVGSLLSLVIHLQLIVWLAMWIGLIAKTQIRAILGSLAALIVWCVLPVIVAASLLSAAMPNAYDDLVISLSPAGIIGMNELNWYGGNSVQFPYSERGPLFRWLVLLGNFGFYGLMLFFIRERCLRNADRYLGRCEDQPAAVPPATITDLQPATMS